MTSRPRLLFLCQTLPYPPDGGVWIRTFHILRLLAQTFDITALCFERAGSAGDANVSAGIDGLRRHASSVEVFELPQKHSRARLVWDHLRSVTRGQVYTTYLYESAPFRRRLLELMRTRRFDLVHVDSLDLAQYLPACAGVPVVCVHHDVESELLGRRSRMDPVLWRRLYLGHQSTLMREVERRWCGAMSLNVAVSDHDRTRLQTIAPGARVLVVPNGVDLDEFVPAPGTPASGIAFVGGTQPSPNLDALEFFSTAILPHLRERAGAVPIRWIGRASPDQQRDYRDRHGIELTGYLDDVRPAMQEAACHVVPLRIGGGTRVKILNAWSMGKAVVSTSVGCEGLAAKEGVNVLVRDEPRDFANAIADVLESETLREGLGRRGRQTVKELYGWTAVGEAMRDAYLSVSTAGGRRTRAIDGAVSHAISGRS